MHEKKKLACIGHEKEVSKNKKKISNRSRFRNHRVLSNFKTKRSQLTGFPFSLNSLLTILKYINFAFIPPCTIRIKIVFEQWNTFQDHQSIVEKQRRKRHKRSIRFYTRLENSFVDRVIEFFMDSRFDLNRSQVP